jgi:hypothetical protein
LDALLPCCTQHLNTNKFSPYLTSLNKLLNHNTSCQLSIGVPSTNNPSCLVKAIHTPRRRQLETLLPTELAVLSAVPQIQMRIGLRSQILLSAEESRTASLNVTTVSAIVCCLKGSATKSYQARSSRDVLKTSREGQDRHQHLHHSSMRSFTTQNVTSSNGAREAQIFFTDRLHPDFFQASTRHQCTTMMI